MARKPRLTAIQRTVLEQLAAGVQMVTDHPSAGATITTAAGEKIQIQGHSLYLMVQHQYLVEKSAAKQGAPDRCRYALSTIGRDALENGTTR